MDYIPFRELTPTQYGKKHGMSKSQVIRRCDEGLLSAYKTEGGHWKIRDYENNDMVPRTEYEQVLVRAVTAEEKINTMRAMLAV
jgi:hypothetical protein